MKNIPWANPDIGTKEFNQVKKSFNNNRFTMGANVKKLEDSFSKVWNSKYSLAVSNGTVALDLALKAIGIKAKDEVIVPAVSYISTASSVSYQGATPVFIDISLETYSMDPAQIERAITKKTKAIIYIDYGGIPSEFKKISKIASKFKLKLILDGAQTLGAKLQNKNLGHNGIVSTVSFHMAKIITTIEGGIICTNSKKIANDIKILRNIGETPNKKYSHTLLGTNARMNDLQAGIGIEQLKKLDKYVFQRNRVAKIYRKLFLEYKILAEMPKLIPDSKSSYFFFPILIKNRNQVSKKLKEIYKIDTRIAYPVPIYEQQLYKNSNLICRKLPCKNAEYFCKYILNLPIFPSMSNKDIETVVRAIHKIQNAKS